MERKTALAVLILAAAGLAGCNGFPTPVPVDEAKSRPPKPLVEQTARVAPEPPAGLPRELSDVAGADWIITAPEYTGPANVLRPAASAGNRPAYVFAWDEPPYDRLLVPARPGAFAVYRHVWQ